MSSFDIVIVCAITGNIHYTIDVIKGRRFVHSKKIENYLVVSKIFPIFAVLK